MNSTLTHSVHDTAAEAEREAALKEFFATIRTAARESDAAVDAAKPALARLATAVAGHDNGQALRIRAILISLYTGGSALADVSNLMALDWALRKDLCAVMPSLTSGLLFAGERLPRSPRFSQHVATAARHLRAGSETANSEIGSQRKRYLFLF